ncbi:MAG: murein L,D-transpeptidase catalytic domain family protein [Elusimicrobiales bacterium]|nr:murein L,D-transpeptidase catalytic domain family protein [Elusimicrobiales bacterium]
MTNMKTGKAETFLVHSKDYDPNHTGCATYFSNTPGFNASSLGFYLTTETYYRKHAYPFILDGLTSTNINAKEMNIALHNVDYASTGGRSLGYQDVKVC